MNDRDPADPIDPILALAEGLYARPEGSLRVVVGRFGADLVAAGGTLGAPAWELVARVERTHGLPHPGTDAVRLVPVDAATALAAHLHGRAARAVEARAHDVTLARSALEKAERALADAEAVAERCASLRDAGVARARAAADAG